MKPENKTISQLKKEADKLCSLYVRQLGADWQGFNYCYTCGVKKHWKELQAGHYISRVYTNTRWHLPNLKPQCYSCNVMKRGNMDEFAIRLEAETPGILKELNTWKHRPSSPNTRLDLYGIIEKYQELLKEFPPKGI